VIHAPDDSGYAGDVADCIRANAIEANLGILAAERATPDEINAYTAAKQALDMEGRLPEASIDANMVHYGYHNAAEAIAAGRAAVEAARARPIPKHDPAHDRAALEASQQRFLDAEQALAAIAEKNDIAANGGHPIVGWNVMGNPVRDCKDAVIARQGSVCAAKVEADWQAYLAADRAANEAKLDWQAATAKIAAFKAADSCDGLEGQRLGQLHQDGLTLQAIGEVLTTDQAKAFLPLIDAYLANWQAWKNQAASQNCNIDGPTRIDSGIAAWTNYRAEITAKFGGAAAAVQNERPK
jgi:hypothetical protein